MTKLHHATVARADRAGIALVSLDGGDFAASFGETTFIHPTAKLLLDTTIAVKTMMDEYPGFTVLQNEGEHTLSIAYKEDVLVAVATFDGIQDAIDEALDSLSDEQRAEMDGASVQQDEEEQERGGSVVPAKYKEIYKERGDINNCGDWMALELAKYLRTPLVDGKKALRTNPDRVEAVCALNGVDVSALRARLETGNGGWVGRFRMSAGILLRHAVAAQGFMLIPVEYTGNAKRKTDLKLVPPAEWVEANRLKSKEKKED